MIQTPVTPEAVALLSVRQSDLAAAKIGLADLDEQSMGIDDQIAALAAQKAVVEEARRSKRAEIQRAAKSFIDDIHKMLIDMGATPETLQLYHVDTRTMIVTKNDPPVA